jgi:hypothetical protein
MGVGPWVTGGNAADSGSKEAANAHHGVTKNAITHVALTWAIFRFALREDEIF